MKTKLVLAALVLAATASPAFASDNICLRHSDVDGWGARTDHSLVVNDRFGRKYLVSLSGLCSDLNWAFGMGFRPIGGAAAAASSCVDRGDRLIMRGGGVSPGRNDTCWVTKVQLYTPDMAQADKTARANHQPLPAF